MPAPVPFRPFARPVMRVGGSFVRRLALACAICAASAAPLSMPVLAQSAAPQLSVGDTVRDAASDTLTLKKVSLAYPHVAVEVGSIVLAAAHIDDAGFRARRVDLADVTIRLTADGKAAAVATIAKATLTQVEDALPSAAALSATGEPGKLPPLVSWLLHAAAEGIAIPELSIRLEDSAKPATLTFKDIAVNGVRAGTVASMGFAGFAVDPLQGASDKAVGTFKTGPLAVAALDLNAYAAWLDDDLAAAASPEKRQVYKSFSLKQLAFADDDASMAIASIAGNNVRLGRPFMKPSDLQALMEKMAADPDFSKKSPADAVAFVRGMLGAYELGDFSIEGLKVVDKAKPPVEIGLIRLEGLAGMHMGEIRLGNLAFTDPDEGASISLGSFAIRGFDILDLDPVLNRVALGGNPQTLPIQDLPKLRVGGIALADLDIDVPGKGRFTVGGLTVDTPDWVGFSPVTLKARLEGFSIPVSAIDDQEARQEFEALGLGVVTISSGFDAAWKEADQTLAAGPASLDIDGLGRAEVSALVGGVPRAVFERPDTAEQAIATLDFRRFEAKVENGGAFSKLVDRLAKRAGTTRKALADEASRKLQGAMIASLGMEDAARSVAAAVRAFVLKPESLRVTVAAIEPIPALTLVQISNGDSDALSLLKSALQIDAAANE